MKAKPNKKTAVIRIPMVPSTARLLKQMHRLMGYRSLGDGLQAACAMRALGDGLSRPRARKKLQKEYLEVEIPAAINRCKADARALAKGGKAYRALLRRRERVRGWLLYELTLDVLGNGRGKGNFNKH